uniref:glycine dehydrogenase (aminomethyl-transferring) n=1 Tax=Meloidogyne javanica TaxID=6303 RepID=A0A915M839_MELJA
MVLVDLDELTNTNVPESIRLREKLGKQIPEEGVDESKMTSPYTPYQPEIAQGRLESLLNFQTMISDLTGLHFANASLLDESTACAEAIALAVRVTKKRTILYDTGLHPQNIGVMTTRSEPMDINFQPLNINEGNVNNKFGDNIAAIILQYPNTEGLIYEDLDLLIQYAHKEKILVIIVCDLLSLTLLRSAGDLGADIAVGSAQRFGLPLGYGGPHAGFMSVANLALARQMPGRIVGVSRDQQGNIAYRLTLQTREQHIRRDKATSNICTAQALPANISAMYAIYHGPNRLVYIAKMIHKATSFLSQTNGIEVVHKCFFDTLKILPLNKQLFDLKCEEKRINVRYYNDGYIGISLDETTKIGDICDILYLFGINICEKEIQNKLMETSTPLIGNSLHSRHSPFLTGHVFNSYHSETQIISWPKLANIHPFVPTEQAKGYSKIFNDLERWLCELTGYDKFSLQPNSGANGEYAGMLAIRSYFHSRGESQRNICLIPVSAHGTNPATAHMANFKVVPVESDKHGNINFKDLSAKSTHGVFESQIKEVCNKIHEHGGQVYLDGANFNAQACLCRPGDYGSDISHFNLHKTFCIPHGGGGPGMGPIGVKSHLAPFLPGHPIIPQNGGKRYDGSVSGAPWGSASILPITWAYIRLMGISGLKIASQMAILNANYMAKRLENAGYRVVYRDEQGLNAHEFIIDCKPFKHVGIEVDDIAKRLMDFGFHAPTMHWLDF